MGWSRERTEVERPPVSVILPQLYLGAESDVTQDQLASLGISYVLSVSRCSPQPSFLPGSRYLRIPIDDSLRDDLLPWIPRALHFIDIAVSSGASVLVHCAAGISRSPALAVAYIMYRLEMDLDHAYRFVKERRPSISPNFNFLGQLQHLQGALSQKPCGHDLLIQQLASCLPPVSDRVDPSISDHVDPSVSGRIDPSVSGRVDPSVSGRVDPSVSGRVDPSVSGHVNPPASSQNSSGHAKHAAADSAQQTQQRHLLSDGGANEQQELWTHHHRQDVHQPSHVPASSPCTPVKPVPKPTQLHLPSGTASLLEKRKSLSLSLTPLGMCPPVQSRKTEERREAKTQSSPGPPAQIHRSLSCSKYSRAEVKEKGLLSPFSSTLNKLLGWGEKVLLGGLFVHPVQMGQPTLPYRC